VSARARSAKRAPRRRDALSDAVLKSFVAGAVAIGLGVGAKLAGLDALAAGTVVLTVALAGSGYAVYGAVATTLHRAASAALVVLVLAAAAVPAARTLWPGGAVAAGALRRAGDEIPFSMLDRRAVWALVTANTDQRTEWWGEYALSIGDAKVTGELWRMRGKNVQLDLKRVRMPANEVRAHYHRVDVAKPVLGIRLVQVVGDVPGGLEVSVFREPMPAWLAFCGWGFAMLAASLFDARLNRRGSLGVAVTIPVFISAFVWHYVTPATALGGAVRAVLAGTFVGALGGYGIAMLVGLVSATPRRVSDRTARS
jgi:hypothetical protein